MSGGNACICGPDGDLLAGPLIGEEGILFADLDLRRLVSSRQQFDPVGHYARGDVLHLTVNARSNDAVTVVRPDPPTGPSPVPRALGTEPLTTGEAIT